MQMTAISDRNAAPAPLQAVETEAALLGALMIDNRWVDRLADILTPEDFFEPVHGRIYSIIVHEVAAGRLANPVLLRPLMENDPDVASLGGPSYLAQLTGSGAALIGARQFAQQIADIAKRRRLYERLEDLSRVAVEQLDQPIESLVESIDAALSDTLSRSSATRSMTIDQAFDVTMKEIEAEARGEAPSGLAVKGLDDWNQLTGNMRRGEVIILAGRPSMGKSAVGLSVALAAARANHGSLFISLEMSVQELTKRAISDLIFEYKSSASYDNVQHGRFTQFDRNALSAARDQIKEWPLILHEDSSLRVGRLAMMIRRYRRQMEAKGQTLDVVFIDYLGLIRSDGKKQSRYEEVTEITGTIKTLARELNVAIVVLAQLNREVERRDDKRPMQSDLRDSGSIEQDADTIIFVYRDEYYLERSEPDQNDKKRPDWEIAIAAARDRVELISAKVRKGRVGKRNCHFFASHQAVRGSNFFSDRGR